jgi:hypothetical protein
MHICVYYDEKKKFILDISPSELDPEIKSKVEETWNQPILREILILISEGTNRLPNIQKAIGHSSSTLHTAVERLKSLGLISCDMIYQGNKQKILSSNIICVTKNAKSKIALQKFFQGLWIDSSKTQKIIEVMSSSDHWWSAEELSAKTKIPVDEISLLLSNFDSLTTKALSQFMKKPPFEKKVMYRAVKDDND